MGDAKIFSNGKEGQPKISDYKLTFKPFKNIFTDRPRVLRIKT
jgi:hypothetical protein